MKNNILQLMKTVQKLEKSRKPIEHIIIHRVILPRPPFTDEDLALYYDVAREATPIEQQWLWGNYPTYTGKLTEERLAKKEEYRKYKVYYIVKCSCGKCF